MDVTVTSATDSDFDIVKNLVPYYIYDMAEYMGWDCNAEGRYDGCDDLPEYWEREDHRPYLIRADGRIAGFALVRPYPDAPDRMEIGEFFVSRTFKGRGVGRAAAVRLFDAFPGSWLVRALEDNVGARRFWEKVISEYTRGDFARSAETYLDPDSRSWAMQFYRFESRGGGG